jgi:voltage-gated potassium channel
LKDNHPLRRLFIIFFGLIIFGTLGFWLLGNSAWISVYNTLIILLSHFLHGSGDSVAQQILTLTLIVGSYFVLAYIVKGSAEYLFEGQFSENRRKKRMAKKILEMEDHYIVAGYGRVGRQVAQELSDEGVDFVVVDRSATEINEAENKGYIGVVGDPIKEETLEAAGVKKAKSVLAALGTDTDNLFLVLTAKSLNPDLYIVARASEEESVSKLEKAGADRVALPYQIGGYHMAAVALRPAVVDFLDVIVDGKHTEMQIEEIHAERGSKMVGGKIVEYFSRKKNGITVLAINHPDGTSLINPGGNEIITRDDQLIVMGAKSELEATLKELE